MREDIGKGERHIKNMMLRIRKNKLVLGGVFGLIAVIAVIIIIVHFARWFLSDLISPTLPKWFIPSENIQFMYHNSRVRGCRIYSLDWVITLPLFRGSWESISSSVSKSICLICCSELLISNLCFIFESTNKSPNDTNIPHKPIIRKKREECR